MLPAVILLCMGIDSVRHGLNTGGVGILTDATVEQFNVCKGDVRFVTDLGQNVTATIDIPCTPWNYSELSIDLCYNWRRPELVGYHSRGYDKHYSCSETGHNAARRLIWASVWLTLLFVIVVLSCSICPFDSNSEYGSATHSDELHSSQGSKEKVDESLEPQHLELKGFSTCTV